METVDRLIEIDEFDSSLAFCGVFLGDFSLIGGEGLRCDGAGLRFSGEGVRSERCDID